jgi:nitroreductase
MNVDDAIRTRRTHKLYRPEPVPRPVLEELLELGRWAPNHHVTNPWRFRVLGTEALVRLKAADPDGAAKLDRAPTLVACSVTTEEDPQQAEEDLLSGACAVYIVMLAAHARGIATYWRTPGVLRIDAGRRAVQIADGERVLGLLHLGTAARDWEPPPRAPVDQLVTFLD